MRGAVFAHRQLPGVLGGVVRGEAADAPPGGHPDEVHLVAPGALAEAVPRELKLRPGLEVIDFDAPPLGQGGFADVRQGTYAFDGAASAPTTVAFKIFRASQALDKSLYTQIVAEARLGLRLQHPCLIELFGILEIPRHGLSLVLECAAGGSLRTVLSDRGAHPELSWGLRVRWLGEIAQGLAKLCLLYTSDAADE